MKKMIFLFTSQFKHVAKAVLMFGENLWRHIWPPTLCKLKDPSFHKALINVAVIYIAALVINGKTPTLGELFTTALSVVEVFLKS